jgi:hypothetical protein
MTKIKNPRSVAEPGIYSKTISEKHTSFANSCQSYPFGHIRRVWLEIYDTEMKAFILIPSDLSGGLRVYE